MLVAAHPIQHRMPELGNFAVNCKADSCLPCLETKSGTWRKCPGARCRLGALFLFYLKNYQTFTIQDT